MKLGNIFNKSNNEYRIEDYERDLILIFTERNDLIDTKISRGCREEVFKHIYSYYEGDISRGG